MKFIRKNGRIIPIGDKKAKEEKIEKRLTKIDVASGVTAGFLGAAFFKRQDLGKALGLGLVATSAATTVARHRTHSTGKAIWEDTKASVSKSIGLLAGAGVGAALLYGANAKKLQNYVKNKKPAQAVIKGLLK